MLKQTVSVAKKNDNIKSNQIAIPVKNDGTKDKRYTNEQIIKQNGTRDMRTNLIKK
jgi:hypothetical protein